MTVCLVIPFKKQSAIGVNSSKGSIQDVDIYQTEWEEEDSSDEEAEMAVTQEKEVSASEKLKEFYKTSKKADAEKKEKQQNKKRTLSSRVGALASRRRK